MDHGKAINHSFFAYTPTKVIQDNFTKDHIFMFFENHIIDDKTAGLSSPGWLVTTVKKR